MDNGIHMNILRPRMHIAETQHSRLFKSPEDGSVRYSFCCNPDGTLLEGSNAGTQESFQKCLDGTFKVEDDGIQAWTHTYVNPAIGECNHCPGVEVELRGFTNTCEKCGTDYNSSGQELAPRSQWGEETGESVSDILSVDHLEDPFE